MFAQSLADIQSPKVVPPSPDAAALGKYGQIPVDKSSGIPSISIPLYEIKTPRFSLPVSLSYHASGIKVSETSPWVGAGWSLNAGGVITRSIVNIPDDGPGGFLYSGETSWQQIYDINYTQNATLLSAICHRQNELQPDNFFYNFSDKSGAFVFGPDAAKTPVLTPYKPLKISYSQKSLFQPGTFTILDESGNTYIFNDTELVSGTNVQTSGASSWYLSQMISADRSDTLHFIYQNDPQGVSELTLSSTQTYDYKPPNNGCGMSSYLGPVIGTTTETNYINPLFIKTILFKGGKVDFVAKNGRLDGPHLSLDSVIVSNYDHNQKKYNRLKSFKINTSYWSNNLNVFNTSGTTGSIYRLKLDSLVENDLSNTAVKTHKFAYDPVILPPVNFYSQDHWGFYNGANQNISLLGQQTGVDIYNNTFTAGNANRSTDPNFIKAGMLEQITYPTKGYTIFEYEPNRFLNPIITTKTTVALQSVAVGIYNPTSTVTFTPTQEMINSVSPTGTFDFHISIKNTSSNGASNSNSYVTLTQGSTVLISQYANSTTDVNTDIKLTLTTGLQYQLIANAVGGDSQQSATTYPYASISTSYQRTNPPGPPTSSYGGGVRIKTIKSYNNNGSILSTESYKYGLTENGVGILREDSLAYTDTATRKYWQYAPGGFNGDYTTPPSMCYGYDKIFSSQPVYALSTLGGSPVAYGAVTVYHGDTVNNNTGKSRYEYTNYPDSTITTPMGYQNGIMLIPTAWKNGQISREAHYRNNGNGQYALVQDRYNNYINKSRAYAMGVYVAYSCETVNFTNDSWPQQWSGNTSGVPDQPNNPLTKYIIFGYPISVGSALPSQTVTINYDTDGVTALTGDTTRYYYDNLTHIQATRIVNYDGKGDSLLNQVSYPQDMVNAGKDPTGIYGTMSTANIINPVIQFTKFKNGTQLLRSITNYSSTNNIINPQTVELQTLTNPSEVRLNYQKYDNSGNLLTVSKQYGPPVSYIWNYNGQYPLAEVKNTPVNDIFYDSFEEGDGNSAVNDSKTGHYSHTGSTGNYTKGLINLDPGTYTLSYWSKSANGKWSLVTNTSVQVTGSSYTITLTGQIDDVRFYPSTAQMTTYTYDPLVGMTSMADAKSDITYYEYDTFQRLINIKDYLGNIIKSFCYNYAGQTTGCSVPAPPPTPPVIYQSDAQSLTFTRSDCGTNATGTAVTYPLPRGAFTSTISIADANQQALAFLNANGPAYAIANGSCTPNAAPNVPLTLINNTNSGYQVYFSNSTTTYSFTFLNNGGQLNPMPSLPAGTYEVNVFPTDAGAGVTHTIELSGQPDWITVQHNYTDYIVAPGPQISLVIY